MLYRRVISAIALTILLGSPAAPAAPDVGDTISADPNGKFPDALKQGKSLDDIRLGTQRMLLVNMHDVNKPGMRESIAGQLTRRAQLEKMGKDLRTWLAATSGGQLDLKIDILDLPVPRRNDGNPWPGGSGKAINTALLPGIGVNISDYQYVYSLNAGIDSATMNSLQNGDVGSGRVGTTCFAGTEDSISFHEVGHNLGLLHAHALLNGISIGNYPNDFTMNSYMPNFRAESGYIQTNNDASPNDSTRSRVTTSPNAPLASLPIGTIFMDYGSVLNVMGANAWGKAQYSPMEKRRIGWLKEINFANINALNPAGTTRVYKLYDDTQLSPVCTGTGNEMRYGAAHGYGDVFYGAVITRPAQIFHVDKAGADDNPTYTGQWTLYNQKLNLYYRGLEVHVGPFGKKSLNPRIAVELDGGVYVGSMQVGQSIREKEIDEHLFAWGSCDNHSRGAQNLDDGTVAEGAPKDFLAYHPGPCKYADQFRPISYKLTFLGTATDQTGEYASLEVTTISATSK